MSLLLPESVLQRVSVQQHSIRCRCWRTEYRLPGIASLFIIFYWVQFGLPLHVSLDNIQLDPCLWPSMLTIYFYVYTLTITRMKSVIYIKLFLTLNLKYFYESVKKISFGAQQTYFLHYLLVCTGQCARSPYQQHSLQVSKSKEATSG